MAARQFADSHPMLKQTPTTCFAAGTLVHTDQGLQPIETLRIGTRVLAQPEHGGKLDYRPIINKVAHLDQQVYAVQVKVEGLETLTTLITTGNHPFWVEAPLAEGEHWLAAECLEPGFVLQLADGRAASVHATGLIRRTQYTYLGVATDDRVGVAIVLDLREKQIQIAEEILLADLATLELGEAFLTPVYNFEVEEFHTYYVGDAGVWVHNTNCPLHFAIRKAEREGGPKQTCFPCDTYVFGRYTQFVNIQNVAVGSWVLSRCEKTGEQAYRRVTKTFEHQVETLDSPETPLYQIIISTPEGRYETDGVSATAEHPFWVNGVGWVNARDLKPGQMLEICDPIGFDDDFRPEDQQSTDLVFSGQRWQAEVLSVKQLYSAGIVYNFEVEEFHTYFVGCNGIWVHNKNPIESTSLNTHVINSQKTPEIWMQNTKCPEGDRAIERITNKAEDIKRCFVEETMVHCDDELTPISLIGVGQKVLSRCEKTGVMAYKKVTKVYEHECIALYNLVCRYPIEPVANPYYNGRLVGLFASPEHPFWVEGKGWTSVGELQIGDEFLSFNGEKVVLAYKNKEDENDLPSSVYNIEVEDFHTYFVDIHGLWVHNKGGYLDETPGPKVAAQPNLLSQPREE